jgi:amphi-Trp domain-containing protein
MQLLDAVVHGRLRREAVAGWLRELADSLVDDGDLVFEHDGRRYGIAMPDHIDLDVEFDVETIAQRTTLGIELRW